MVVKKIQRSLYFWIMKGSASPYFHYDSRCNKIKVLCEFEILTFLVVINLILMPIYWELFNGVGILETLNPLEMGIIMELR